MSRELSPHERDFIRGFKQEKGEAPTETEKLQLQKAKREHRSLVGFIVWVAFLVMTPFLISGAFLYQMSQFNALFEDEVIGALLNEGKSFEEVVQSTPLEGMGSIYEIYENRMVIVAGIFAVFFFILLLSLAVKALISLSRNKKD